MLFFIGRKRRQRKCLLCIQIHLMLFFIELIAVCQPRLENIQIHLMLFFIWKVWMEPDMMQPIQIHLMLFFIVPEPPPSPDAFSIQIHLMLFFIPRISAFSYITIPQASLYFNILSFFTSRICFPAKFFVSSSYSLYFRDSV